MRLESIAVSAPKRPKRIKIVPTEPVPSAASVPIVTCTNLHDLPSEVMGVVLAFLAPDLAHPAHADCGLVHLSRVSKSYRALALGNQLWRRICIARWSTKVGHAARLAQADSEANAEKDTANTTAKGKYWYRKFGAEERDASRTTITRDELYSTTFSIRLWFQSKRHPDMKRIKGALASGLDGYSLSDAMHFDPSGQLTGMPDPYNGDPFFINDTGSIVNFGIPFDDGTHPLVSLYVHRRKDWGWELRSQLYVIRSIVGSQGSDIAKLWEEYSSCLVIQKRKKGVTCNRGSIKYKRREVPDIAEIKGFLTW
uniref:F-box domain-containing protein n=1 Tax=Minutocellus polymorphus TaxID=265543 RepID=A0A7S0AXS8_9STRA|mmetsp:Transcript_5197/g.8847  ORF Transcript_5197/g.8847 Transcript_5197/m.8847 type:complete len:311 (+) Transcript_5197:42-974(+)|eukprot:CAMPEP_0197723036 /NCGR_PEP_ID=MMETSP1434-20131217/5494_1 /TAXON_ID=265543 /ORGANISM="Minutocellus polymorphus, Strain CCMP3303" /LENGTH=310 /DNA_ID=CAMNT_0043308241 /DNA_START=49 /DNA_END=978 /DNA_ORIENTATION=-